MRQTAQLLKRCVRASGNLEKEIVNLTHAQDKVSIESPEYYLLAQAKGNISEALSHLGIVMRRIQQN